ncbi:MAG: nickel-dependent lactate racemase [Candidatus Bipolaricaulota bacterium]|nr:nickel-dependent lactate racemase [Candidatus Bipolaricaulota bacterium]
MPRFDLAYGRTTIPVDVPDRNLIGVLEPRSVPKVDLRDAFDAAWRSPRGLSDPLDRLVSGRSLALVVTDHTRSTPTKEILPLLWDRIRARVSASDVTIVVATGTHRAPTDAELERMFGEWRRTFRVLVHDCDADLVEVGCSSRGTPILINRAVAEAGAVITIGHVGMHYCAGYTGGRKNILPGVAGRATIEANHAQLLDPRSAACVYDGNPISEEMVEAARRVNVAFIVDVVMDADRDVAKVVVGEPEAAHAEARSFWDRYFKVRVEQPADLVIASAGGHPKDIDLYQAYKAQYTAARALHDGGILLLLAACPDGVGHRVFEDWIKQSERPADVFGILRREGFKLGGHKAVYFAADLARIDVFLKSELDDDETRRFFLRPVRGPDEVFAEARQRFGGDFRVLVLPHAADTFPVIAP